MKICKKCTSAVLMLALVLTCFAAAPATVKADTYHSGDFAYTLADGKATIVKYNGNSGYVVVPAQIDGYPVAEVGHEAFYGNGNINTLIVEEGIHTIDRYAFENCANLTSITLPQSLTTLGGYAFASCYSLTEVTVPGGVKFIDEYTFGWCDNLTTVTLGEGVTALGYQPFYYCEKLSTVNFPSTLRQLSAGAFYGCYDLIRNTYDNGLYLGSANNPYQILVGPLYWDITTCMVHPDTQVIAEDAFYGCSYLQSITMPEGLKSIDKSAFEECYSLTSASIPNSVEYIGDDAFYDCNSLNYTVYNDAQYLGNANNPYILLVSAVSRDLTSCQVHPNTRVIGPRAFQESPNLIEVVIPDSVTSLGSYVFYNSYNLKKIVLSKNITSIPEGTFYGCSSLESITIPDGVTSVGAAAFYNCHGLKSITVPSSLKTVDYNAFYSCYNVEEINYTGTEEQWGKIVYDGYTNIGELLPITPNFNYQIPGTVPTPGGDPSQDPSEGPGADATKPDDDDDD